MSGLTFRVNIIPLNREEIIDFLLPSPPMKLGASFFGIRQRANMEAGWDWANQLRNRPGILSLIARDEPIANIKPMMTTQLVPVESLNNDPTFLTRNLGGWSPVWFGVMGFLGKPKKSDPVLKHAITLVDYGEFIDYFGAHPAMVDARLEEETSFTTTKAAGDAIIRMFDWLKEQQVSESHDHKLRAAKALYLEIRDGGALTRAKGKLPPVPRVVLLDTLLGLMVDIEEARRDAYFTFFPPLIEQTQAWQQQLKEETGLTLILKAEYIMGRGRCSAVLIAPELGCVVKQPGPEPFHEAELGAAIYNGLPENRPRLTEDGQLVTSAGRIRLIIEEGLIERLNRVFHHDVQLCSLLGIITEPYVSGPTLQEYVLEQHDRLTPEVYEFIQLHQQVCEVMGVENGDWHAANFIVMPDKPNPIIPEIPMMVHIDWGAARALKSGELTHEGTESRYNQVKNIAFSYQDAHLAKISERLHNDLAADPDRRNKLRTLAEKLVKQQG